MRLFFAQAQLGLLTGFLHLYAVLSLSLIWMLFSWDLYTRGRDSESFRFWLRVFALTAYSAMGLGLMTLVQNGLVLPLAVDRMGNVLGPLLLGVVLIAFAVRSTTFGVMLYSRHRVTPIVFRVSLFVTALGLTAIVLGMSVLESWMRAPSGAALLDGQFRIFDWFDVTDNAQLPLQLVVVGLTAGIMLSSALASGWLLQALTEGDTGKPASATRLLVWAGLLCTMGVLPLSEHILAGSTRSLSDIIEFLAGNTQTAAHQFVMLQVARALLVLWSLHVVILMVTLWHMYRCREPLQSGRLGRIGLLGSVSGPLLCLSIWWLLNLVKGPDMVVGQLLFADLINPVQTQYLFLGFVLTCVLITIVVYGWTRLTYQALASGVVTVHRPKALLS